MDAEPIRFPGVNRILRDLSDDAIRELAPSARFAAVGELTAGAVHELNNPLFAMLALAELMLADAEPGSQDEEWLRLLRSSGIEMKETIRVLLEFVRADDGGPRPAALDGAARAAVRLFRRTSMARRLEVGERYPAQPVLVDASSGELQQLGLHLLLHARAATGEAGRIEVEVTREDGAAVLSVRDDGGSPRPDAGVGLLVAGVLARDRGGTLETETPGCLRASLPAVD